MTFSLAAKFATIFAVAKNLATNTEFPNGVTDAPTRAGLISAATGLTWPGGITTGLAIGYDGVTTSAGYKSVATAAGRVVTISVFVAMDDGLIPAFGSASGTSALNDFVLVINGLGISPLTYTTASIGGGVYRVSGSAVSNGAVNCGVLKNAGNSTRPFTFSGMQVNYGAVASRYQKRTV